MWWRKRCRGWGQSLRLGLSALLVHLLYMIWITSAALVPALFVAACVMLVNRDWAIWLGIFVFGFFLSYLVDRARESRRLIDTPIPEDMPR